MSSEKTDQERPVSPVPDTGETTPVGPSASQSIDEKNEKPVGKPASVKEVTAATTADDEDLAIEYPSGPKLALITLGLSLSVFVVALDNTIIATAIPRITSVFNSLDDVGWYGSSYLLTMTSLQPTFGKIYSHFDVKYTFLIALIIFEVGSVICAAATTSEMLIVGRAIAGIGASAIFSGAMNIITFTVPLAKRAIYVAALSSMFGIASVVGPLMGGAFTDNAKLTWRWCFWINLPLGGITFFAIFFFFRSPARKSSTLSVKERIGQIDILGAFLLIGGITCLLLALQWGGTTYPWKSPKIYGLFIGFGLIILIFIGLQFHRGEFATIPPRLLKQRTVLVCGLFTALFGMAMYTHIFYLPFYFQAIKGTTAVQSGIRTIPYLVSITISSIIIGGIITVTGVYHWFFYFGTAVFVVGAAMIHTLDVPAKIGKWFGYQVLAGLGGGASIQIPFLAVQVALPTADVPIGIAIVIFFNSLGGAIAVSIAQNIFANELVKNIIKNVPSVNPAEILGAGATEIARVVQGSSPEVLAGILEAYSKAIQMTFIPPIAFAGLATLVSLFIERINVKGKKLEPGAA